MSKNVLDARHPWGRFRSRIGGFGFLRPLQSSHAWPGLPPIFPDRSRVRFSRRKTMALNLGADCGQTRGQYPAPPPEQPLSLKVSFRQIDLPVRSILPEGKILRAAEAGAKQDRWSRRSSELCPA